MVYLHPSSQADGGTHAKCHLLPCFCHYLDHRPLPESPTNATALRPGCKGPVGIGADLSGNEIRERDDRKGRAGQTRTR